MLQLGFSYKKKKKVITVCTVDFWQNSMAGKCCLLFFSPVTCFIFLHLLAIMNEKWKEKKYVFLPRDITMVWQPSLLPSYWPEPHRIIFTGFPGQSCVEIVTYQTDPRVGIIISFQQIFENYQQMH